MLALDGNTLAGGSLTFLWLSARPRVPRIWPGHLPGPLCMRLAGEGVRREDWSGRGAASFPAAGGSRGPRFPGLTEALTLIQSLYIFLCFLMSA